MQAIKLVNSNPTRLLLVSQLFVIMFICHVMIFFNMIWYLLNHPLSPSSDLILKYINNKQKMRTNILCSFLRTWRQLTTTQQRPPMTPCWCLTTKEAALTQEASPLWTRRAAETRTTTASMNGDPASRNWPTCTEEEKMTCCKYTKEQTLWICGYTYGYVNDRLM